MEHNKLALSIVSFVGSFGVGVEEIPTPEGMPIWLAALIAAVGPGVVSFLWAVANASVQVLAAYLKRKAELKKQEGLALQSNNDTSDDDKAKALIQEAEAEIAAAEKAEELLQKLEERKR